jgi:lipopolysaccharide transport system ATP-binding protein
MYVRLAFAVAAHLEPEILIVDEVLAVGDAEFQKKCLGKMQDVSKKGRTVLLVTHNLTVIRNLCNKTLYLKNGVTASIGETSKVIDEYLIEDQISTDNGLIPEDASIYNNGDAKFLTFNVLNLENKTVDSLYFEQDFIVELTLKVNRPIEKAVIDLSIGSLDTRYTYTSTFDSQNTYLHLEEGVHQIRLQASPRVIPGAYTFYLGIHDYGKNGLTLDFIEKIGVVNVLQFREKSGEKFHLNASLGNVIVKGNWEINKL